MSNFLLITEKSAKFLTEKFTEKFQSVWKFRSPLVLNMPTLASFTQTGLTNCFPRCCNFVTIVSISCLVTTLNKFVAFWKTV